MQRSLLEDDAYKSTMKFVTDTIQDAKRKTYQLQHEGSLPDSVLEAISTNNKKTMDRQFQELIERETSRRSSSASSDQVIIEEGAVS